MANKKDKKAPDKKPAKTTSGARKPITNPVSGSKRNHGHRPRLPYVYFTQAVDDYMTEIASLTTTEVGGLGYVTVNDAGHLVVDEVFVIPQEASAGHVSFKENAIIDATVRAMEAGRINDLRFSWHSHGNLDVFWSNTDEGGIQTYLNGGAPWLLSSVINRDGHCLSRLDVKDVEPLGHAVWDLETKVLLSSRTAGKAADDLAAMVDRWDIGYGSVNPQGNSQNGRGAGAGGYPRGWTWGDAIEWDPEEDEPRIKDPDAPLELVMPTEEDLERAAEEDERDAIIADDLKLTLAEVRKLTEAGHKPEEMDADAALDALIAIDLGEAGIGSESEAQRVG